MDENTPVVQAEPTPALVEAPVEATPPKPTEAPAEQPPTSPAPVDPEKPRPGRAEKRIQQLISERDHWRNEALSRLAQAFPAPPETVGGLPQAPVVDKFDNYDDYLVAKAKHEVTVDRLKAETQQRQFELNRAFAEKISKEAADDPEILDIVQDTTLPINPPMAEIIKLSDTPGEILRYLSDNRDEARRLYQMNPYLAAREIGKIEVKLIQRAKPQEPVRKVTQAPEPIRPVQPSGSPTIDLEKVDINEFMQRRNEGMKSGKLRR